MKYFTIVFIYLISFMKLIQANEQTIFEEWKHLIEDTISFEEVTNFLSKHPDLPRKAFLQEKAEQELKNNENEEKIIEWFSKNPPVRGEGVIAYAKCLLKKGQNEEAKNVLQAITKGIQINPSRLSEIRNFSSIMPKNWAFQRANFLLYREKIEEAQALIPFLNESEKDIISVRIALIKKQPEAYTKAKKLLQFKDDNQGLIFEIIRYCRKTNNTDEAFELFTQHQFSDENQHYEVFWAERNILARRYLEQKLTPKALKLIKDHKLKPYDDSQNISENYVNAQWLVAWLYITTHKNVNEALSLLQNLLELVKSPISKSRMLYWISECYRLQKHNAQRIESLKQAATYSTTFYGQIALSHIRIENIKTVAFEELKKPPINSSEKFKNTLLMKIIKNVKEASSPSFREYFFQAALTQAKTPQQQYTVFELAQEKGFDSLAIRLSKKFSFSFAKAYPLLSPTTQKNTLNHIVNPSSYKKILPALVHAIIRRESCFDTLAKSPAGAMGLMQLMPQTAEKEQKRLHKNILPLIKSAKNLFNQSKNIILGASHLDFLLKKYNGNLILTIAAYNAGAKAVDEWIQTFGHPSYKNTNIINWIESIPYAETRNYVQRVLENFMVYQYRLSKENESSSCDLLQYIKAKLI